MACNIVSISINFSAPLCCCVPQTSLKKMCSEKSALGRLSHKASVVTATNFPAPCSSNSNRGLFSVSRSCHCHLTATCKRCDEIVNCSFDVSSCTHTIITGYWVGPDIDDGWGFVEAFVNRMT
ncbi:hypothetical protein LWI28_007020 [Acer negundo]|uniref:Uncharacterized protein n=1 Tax=Acer negundo TaxID=4023 RepID=A0AAD5J4G9_ACENE|nr:hypothetical protein LWI28_007020 [Acer negundo]KAK4851572.1 hypothetical protein QYF36_016449 [Acer negundo]